MKDRWQKSLEAAVAAYDTPMPWERGTQRKAMLARRNLKVEQIRQERQAEARRA